jgi:hypothetical protein
MPTKKSASPRVSPRKGLLLVTMEPPASLEAEFHDWYDTEHFLQRMALPGFESGSRWVCLRGWPRWLALYDLASTAAVETEAYRAVSGANSTSWSQRILPRMTGRMRVIAEQVLPGNAVAVDPRQVSQLLVARYPLLPTGRRSATITAATKAFETLKGVLQLRLFTSPRELASDLWVIAAFDRPIAIEALISSVGHLEGIGANFFNVYAPYYRVSKD